MVAYVDFTAPEALFPLCISVTTVRQPLGWTLALLRRPSPLRNAKREVRRILYLQRHPQFRSHSYSLDWCWWRAVDNTQWLNSWGGSVLLMPVTLQKPPSPAGADVFPNGCSDTCSVYRCSISQKAIFRGPLCIKISCEPRVFAKPRDVALAHAAGEGRLLLSGDNWGFPLSLSAPSQCFSHREHTPGNKSVVLVLLVGKLPAVKLPVKASFLIACVQLSMWCQSNTWSDVVGFFPVSSVPRAALWLGEDRGPPVWHILCRVSTRLCVTAVFWFCLWNVVLKFSHFACVITQHNPLLVPQRSAQTRYKSSVG